MMYLFRTNNPLVIVFYVVYLIGFRMVYFFRPLAEEIQCPEVYKLSSFFSVLPGGMTGKLIAGAVLTAIQALIVNRIVHENRFSRQKNHFAGVFYIILASFFPSFLWFSSFSLGFTFLLLASMRMFGATGKEQAAGDLFDIGWMVSLGMLIHIPFIFFLPMFILWQAILRPFQVREYLALLWGFFTPVYLLFSVDFLADLNISYQLLWQQNVFNAQHSLFMFTPENIISLVSFAVLLGITFFTTQAALFSSLIQIRKQVLCMYLLMIFGGIVMGLSLQCTFLGLLPLVFPLSVFLTLGIQDHKAVWVGETAQAILILIVLLNQYFYLLNPLL